MIDARPVFVADSCVGGLSVLKSLRDSGYANEAVFLADYQINPLGLKDDATIASVVDRWMHIASAHSDTMIMACNTLSIHYQHLLDSGANLPKVKRVISMVDCFKSMVRAEAEILANRKVLVVGTMYTASQNIYRDILAAGVDDVSVDTIAATELERQIARIERWDAEKSLALTGELRQAIKGADVAVLACTCFPMVAAQLQRLFPDVRFLDPGKYCAEYLQETNNRQHHNLQMKVTGDVVSPRRAADFARSYLQVESGEIECCN